MSWKTLAISVASESAEVLETMLWDSGAVSVTLTDAEDQPLFEPGPGEVPLWANMTVTAMYEDDADTESLAENLKAQGYDVLFTDELGDRVWEREWLSQFKPLKFGEHLWICPSGYAVEEPDAVILHLDPGLAFGTGTHPTTALCLEWLDGNLRPGETLLDYGCGSGILGIAGRLLGAKSIVAVDNDPQALIATEDNAERNGVQDDLLACLPEQFVKDEQYARQYDVVVANILAQPLVELAHQLSNMVRPGGHLVLSGIMSSQKDWVAKAYRLELMSEKEVDGWVCLSFRRAP
jgi:ribosomal protein L11 methyltransferase